MGLQIIVPKDTDGDSQLKKKEKKNEFQITTWERSIWPYEEGLPSKTAQDMV